jgi:hypothetical protein
MIRVVVVLGTPLDPQPCSRCRGLP